MTITIRPDLEATLHILSESRGVTPEEFLDRLLVGFKETIAHQQRLKTLNESGKAVSLPSLPVGANIPLESLRAEGIYD